MDILYLVTLLTVKHFFADFTPLQTHYMLKNKGIYGHWGGISHAGVHTIFSLLILVIASSMYADSKLLLALYLCAGEFIVHYHMDWFKEKLGKIKGWTMTDYQYWILFGVDQLVHHVTYIVMIWFFCLY